MIPKKFLRKTLLRKISYTIKFHSKNPSFQLMAVFEVRRALNFKWNAFTAGISWQQMHSKLVGCWHLFTFFAGAPFLCTQSVKLGFCFILIASNTVIWASLFGARRFKHFIFHVILFSRETFQTLAWKFLLCVPQKIFGVYIFPYFVLK